MRLKPGVFLVNSGDILGVNSALRQMMITPLDSHSTGIAKALRRVSKGFSEKIKISGLTKGLTKCDKKGLTIAISLI